MHQITGIFTSIRGCFVDPSFYPGSGQFNKKRDAICGMTKEFKIEEEDLKKSALFLKN
jgi:hypothetical protein